jgi:hypothetical protein
VRLRVLVVAAFFVMVAVPGVLAWTSGFMPGPTQASAGSAGPHVTSSALVADLAWPEQPLGLAATDSAVLWQQRAPSVTVAGVWSYDAQTGRTAQLLPRAETGKAVAFPAAGGELLVWASWTSGRGAGPTDIRAYDTLTTRLWQVAGIGTHPAASGRSIVWVGPRDGGRGADVIHVSDSVTDEEHLVTTDGRVRDVASWGRWVVWAGGDGGRNEVWAASFGSSTRYRLARNGAAVVIGPDRILWAASAGRHSTAIVSWDRRSRRSTVLWRMPGKVSSLSMDRTRAVWATSRDAVGSQIWAYDFQLGKAYTVSTAGGRQVSPVIVAGSVYWADDRSGHWQLYSRSLQQ